jgi:alpha-aminoadipate carrier protein LysW
MQQSLEFECPDCGTPKNAPTGAELGQVLACSCCGTVLEIMGLAPPMVQRAPQIEEDFGE